MSHAHRSQCYDSALGCPHRSCPITLRAFRSPPRTTHGSHQLRRAGSHSTCVVLLHLPPRSTDARHHPDIPSLTSSRHYLDITTLLISTLKNLILSMCRAWRVLSSLSQRRRRLGRSPPGRVNFTLPRNNAGLREIRRNISVTLKPRTPPLLLHSLPTGKRTRLVVLQGGGGPSKRADKN